MKIKSILIIATGILLFSSCKNKGTKPLLPYYLGEDLNEVWILPEQEKKAFINLPDFQLKDQFDVNIERKHLLGQAFVLNFFYRDCKNACSIGMKAMDSLQNRLFDDEVLFISFSLDADKDDNKTLKSHSENYNVNPEKWRLLSGDQNQINQILKEVLKKNIIHPNDYKDYHLLYLFDKDAYLRGIYDLKNEVAIENLILDTRLFR